MKALAVVPILIALAAAACGAAGPQSAGPVPTVALPSEPAAAPASARPQSPRVGFIGLPPDGAIPSLPRDGKLVASFFGGGPSKGKAVAWLYEDGRLIWLRQGNYRYGANRIVTGYLEQRLTPAGVEAIRSELLSTGIFRAEADAYDDSVEVQVRDNSGRLLLHGQLTNVERRHFRALFTDLAGWLPDSLWANARIRAYVPWTYALCFVGQGRPALEPALLLSLLPAPAEQLLGSRAPIPGVGGTGILGDDRNSYCWEVTTREARAIATPLQRAGLERFAPAWLLGFDLAGNGVFQFEPLLPDGGRVCTPCG